jgi:hypothetical protein
VNLKKIKEIVNSSLLDETKESYIIKVLADDKQIIVTLLKILEAERQDNHQLLSDTNAELSRAVVAIESPKAIDGKWVVEQIRQHYIKWQHKIRCCMRVNGFPE